MVASHADAKGVGVLYELVRGWGRGVFGAEREWRLIVTILKAYSLTFSDVRLADDKCRYNHQGRLEIRINGVWGMICRDDCWTGACPTDKGHENAKVACRSMGLRTYVCISLFLLLHILSYF